MFTNLFAQFLLLFGRKYGVAIASTLAFTAATLTMVFCLKGLIADAPGKETYLYGMWLPKLYFRTTGAKFGISKDSDGHKIRITTGVAFVIGAAAVIGLKPTPSNVADHFNKFKRYLKNIVKTSG